MTSKSVRQQVLDRDGAMCTECGFKGSRKNPLQMHHVVYRCQGGPSTLSNLKTICFECHRKIHSFDKPIKRRKKRRRR